MHGKHIYMRGVTQRGFKPDVAKSVFNTVVKLASPTQNVHVIFELNPSEKIRSVDKSATAFFNRGDHFNVLVGCAWKVNNPDQAKYGRDAVYEVSDLIVAGEESPEESKARVYGNYGEHSKNSSTCRSIYEFSSLTDTEDLINRNKASELFGSNYPRLQQLKKKYDPNVIFDKWVVIYPASG